VSDVPVIQVFAQPLDDVTQKLDALCHEVADALGLKPDDVVGTFVAVTETVVPGHLEQSWPVVVIHGSPRAAEAMREATGRVHRLAASWAGENGGAWVTWQVVHDR
jgi:hypothetical protein